MPQILIRNAVIDEADAITQIERECWPAELANSIDRIQSRIAVFPVGQWVATCNDKIVGVIFAQRLIQRFFETTTWTYDSLTDNGTFASTHEDQGEIYQLVDVSVSRAAKGMNLGRKLVDQQVEFARSLAGVSRIVGFTRPAKFSEHQHMSIDEYVDQRNGDGCRLDPVLSFHLDNGATLVKPVENYRSNDSATAGFGVLIEYSADH